MTSASPTDEPKPDTPHIIDITREGTEDVLNALSSSTARQVLLVLSEQPTTKSGLASRIDTSIQNVSYHLDNLRNCQIVEVVDQTASKRGREMNVYGLCGQPLVLVSGDSDHCRTLKKELSGLLRDT